MNIPSVREYGKAWWSEVYNRIIGADVYIDEASAECLHWDGGLFNLLDGGAVSVKPLSVFEYSKDTLKAVFITQATSLQLKTIEEIIRSSNFRSCTLLSCASLDVVYLELNEDRDVSDVISSGKASIEATKQLKDMLQTWIGKQQSIVEVVYVPMFTIAPTNVIFLTPPYKTVYPLFDGKLIPETSSLDLYSLNSEERSCVRRLSGGLNSLLDSMNLKEDVYYMGAFSSLVAGILTNSPVCNKRRKNCTNPASLIIVDRTLDLCGVTTYSTESILDKMMSVLPRFNKHSNEVAIDMSPLCEANRKLWPNSEFQPSPGCMYHADDEGCMQTYDHMINKSQKEVMIDLYNKLSKIDVQKSPSPKTLLKVTSQSIEKIVTAVKGNYDLICKHLGLLQQALGVVETLKSPKRAQQELLMNLEKQVLQNLAASRESTSVLNQISNLIKTRKERNMSLEHLLSLIVHVYSLAGTEVTFPKQHEDALVETLSVAIFEEKGLDWGTNQTMLTPELCDEMTRSIMARLKHVAQMRKHLKKYNGVMGPSGEYSGVLQQLVEDLVGPERPGTDLAAAAPAHTNLLATPLSILGKRTKPKHPMDNPTVIIFVIGGITAEECKQLNRIVITSGIDNTVLIGSTKFASPTDALRDVLQI